MKYRPLGNTGLEVSVLGFGGSSLGNAFREIEDAEGIRTVHVAVDNGINMDVDQIQSYCHYCLNDTALLGLLPYPREKGVAVFNSAPLAMRLLSADGPPDWHPAPEAVRKKCAKAAFCRERGADLGKLALQFSVANKEIPTHIVGTASPKRILQNIREIEEPIDGQLLAEVQRILAPIHDVIWTSGRPENN